MRSYQSLRLLRATFFATLGLTPLVACSSSDANVSNPHPDAGTGGTSGSGGTAATGGSHSVLGTGGTSTATGGTGGASTGGSSGKDGGSDGGSSICHNPKPRLGTDGKPTGFVDCDGNFTHRVEKKACATKVRNTTCGSGSPVTDAGRASGQCSKDSDCTDQADGVCTIAGIGTDCYCNYGCTTDADCGDGYICGCGDPVGQCIPTANCTVDADCGSGLLCMTSLNDFGCGTTFGCQAPADTCVTSADCPSDGGPLKCVYSTDHHECSFGHPCGTGRPFLVGGAARVAALACGDAWSAAMLPNLEGLDEPSRRAVADHWTDVALMEHASIAAFARFMLDLLSLGAPPSLVYATQSAMADETRHAQEAFALASAYAGRALCPGAMTVADGLENRTFIDIVRTTVLEGCIGETVAAAEAAEALEGATDPAVRATLARVAVDEARHAELAWQFLSWALATGSITARQDVARELRAIVDAELAAPRLVSDSSTDGETALAAHGVLNAATRADLRRRVLVDVIAPCVEALLASQRARLIAVAA